MFPLRLKANYIYAGGKNHFSRSQPKPIFELPTFTKQIGGRKTVYLHSEPQIYETNKIDDKWLSKRMIEVCGVNGVPLHYIFSIERHNNNNFVLARTWAEIINARKGNERPIDIEAMRLLSTAHDFGRLVTGSSDARVGSIGIDAAYHGYIGFRIFNYYANRFLEQGKFEQSKMCTDFSEICLYHSGFGYTSKNNRKLGLGRESTIIHNAQQSLSYTEMALIALADTKSMYASYPEKNMIYSGPFTLSVDDLRIMLKPEWEAIVFDTISNSVLLKSRTGRGIRFKKLAPFNDLSIVKIINTMDGRDDIEVTRTGGLHASLRLRRGGKDKEISIDNLETIELVNHRGRSYTVDIVGYVIASRGEVHRRYDQFDRGRKPALIDSIFDYIIAKIGRHNAHLVNGADHPTEELSIPAK